MKNNQAGQSTIEFIFSFIFAVSLILLVFNTSLNYAAGYVTHYATFMASRAFLTQDSSSFNINDRSDAVRLAQETFQKYNLSVFGISNSGLQINDQVAVDAGQYLMVGVYTRFERKMDLVGQITGQTKLELISESFLGREPSRAVCASRVCRALTGKEDDCRGKNLDITLFDDGC